MTTIARAILSANWAMAGKVVSQVCRWAVIRAPPKTPVNTLTRVMPTWTVGRNRCGSSDSSFADAAPFTPLRSSTDSLARRTETRASSLSENSPFSTISNRMTAISRPMVIRVPDRRDGRTTRFVALYHNSAIVMRGRCPLQPQIPVSRSQDATHRLAAERARPDTVRVLCVRRGRANARDVRANAGLADRLLGIAAGVRRGPALGIGADAGRRPARSPLRGRRAAAGRRLGPADRGADGVAFAGAGGAGRGLSRNCVDRTSGRATPVRPVGLCMDTLGFFDCGSGHDGHGAGPAGGWPDHCILTISGNAVVHHL